MVERGCLFLNTNSTNDTNGATRSLFEHGLNGLDGWSNENENIF